MMTPARDPNPSEQTESTDLSYPTRYVLEVYLAVVLQADGTVSMVDTGDSSAIFQKTLASEDFVCSAALLRTAARELNAKPLFSLYIYDSQEAPDEALTTVCQLTVCPRVPLGQLWDAESSWFVDQHDARALDVNRKIIERRFAGEFIYECEHKGLTSDFKGPLFTPWRESLAPPSGQESAPIRYADVLTPLLTFWVEHQKAGEEAGLIAPLPLTDRQIGGIAAFLHAAGGEDFSVESHEKWFREALNMASTLLTRRCSSSLLRSDTTLL